MTANTGSNTSTQNGLQIVYQILLSGDKYTIPQIAELAGLQHNTTEKWVCELRKRGERGENRKINSEYVPGKRYKRHWLEENGSGALLRNQVVRVETQRSTGDSPSIKVPKVRKSCKNCGVDIWYSSKPPGRWRSKIKYCDQCGRERKCEPGEL